MASPNHDSDEERLRRAILLSLGEEVPASSPHDSTSSSAHAHPEPATENNTGEDQEVPTVEIIDLDSDSDDSQHPPSPTRGFSLATLDRKQMERDRMARQDARKRDVDQTSPAPDDSRDSKRVRQEDDGESRASSVAPRAPGTAIRRNQAFAHARLDAEAPTPTYATYNPPNDDTTTDVEGLRPLEPEFLNPTIKKTWCFGQPRGGDIKIEEILQKNHLGLVVVSTFQFDTEWWYNKIDVDKTKQVWIRGIPTQEMRDVWSEAVSQMTNVSLYFADMSGSRMLFHSKFFLLSFPKFLRIVVTSANITDWDWGERGVMENTVLLVDLPRLPEGQSTKEEDLPPFAKDLLHYLREMGLRERLLGSLLRFDFTRTKDLAFVHSLAGIHHGNEAHLTGITALCRAVKSLNLEADSTEVDYATASLGALKVPFAAQMLAAARGQEITPYNPKVPATAETAADVTANFRVFFPTKQTIQSSRGGPNAAGTITFRQRFFEADNFPHECMRDHQSTRPGVLSHSKIMLARGQRKAEGDDKGANVAWVYVGSHNLTESAWGSFTVDLRTKKPKMSIRNYECGIVVRVPEEQLGDWTGRVPDYDVFAGTIAIPFVAPGARYNGREPWYMDFSN
ncbi:tyrosyl-DNA phosphodiesterase-domain-containing protein [Phyllosticta capitalensis]|uniref:tyrosyl-DNA phosphodiesterase-domain-containing protein n=1 Tax=Phyllosticta capitalensis TaxID=121624 RepID=UPI00312F10AF